MLNVVQVSEKGASLKAQSAALSTQHPEYIYINIFLISTLYCLHVCRPTSRCIHLN